MRLGAKVDEISRQARHTAFAKRRTIGLFRLCVHAVHHMDRVLELLAFDFVFRCCRKTRLESYALPLRIIALYENFATVLMRNSRRLWRAAHSHRQWNITKRTRHDQIKGEFK